MVTVPPASVPSACRERLAAMWPTELPIDMQTHWRGESSDHLRSGDDDGDDVRDMVRDVLRGRLSWPMTFGR